jgi:hypothetical protein
MDNEKLNEIEEAAENPVENSEFKVDELGDGDLEDASGGLQATNTGCNCNCGIE